VPRSSYEDLGRTLSDTLNGVRVHPGWWYHLGIVHSEHHAITLELEGPHGERVGVTFWPALATRQAVVDAALEGHHAYAS
jgi:hypothetical protein